ncbi:E3 ubiquitin-protein ligase RSL1-like [Quercus robur]|uniref:E3 ubiquitin-protein ligase RSL1-like n=1 Tax=Quercus robur TaxID=38942 RepID=UPI0021633249|nr:E3 ubiquitin-protein ligase RSL1-like [Quercus robur]
MGNTLKKNGRDLKKPQEEQVEEDPVFTCEICIEPMQSNKKFNNNNNCVHPFCMDCIAKYVETQIDNKVANIKCPSLYCTQLLDSLFCRRIISKPLFDKWCDILFESTVLKVEEKCYCPDPQCSTLVLNECKIVTKSECPVCKKEFCFQCKTRWHAGYRCNESGQLRDENDVLLGRLIEEKKWSRCPNCGHAVERVDGCNDVICRCQTRFCHKCGQKSHFGQCGEKELEENLCSNILQYILVVLTMISVYVFIKNNLFLIMQ